MTTRSLSRAVLGALAVTVLAALAAPAAPALAADRSGPQVRVLGFTTYPRLGTPAVQAKPGKTLTDCQTRPPDNRDLSVVWSGRGISKGTRVGVALWTDNPRTAIGPTTEPPVADIMRSGFKWDVRASESRTNSYGYVFGPGPFGPQQIDGRWFAAIAVAGRVLVRKSVTIACR